MACTLDDDGLITAWQLHIFGKSKGCKLDASAFFTEQEEGNSVRIQELDLDTLVFRGSMVSEWVHPAKYHWEYRLPHESNKKKYYRVNEAEMGQHMAEVLWLRLYELLSVLKDYLILSGNTSSLAQKCFELSGAVQDTQKLC